MWCRNKLKTDSPFPSILTRETSSLQTFRLIHLRLKIVAELEPMPYVPPVKQSSFSVWWSSYQDVCVRVIVSSCNLPNSTNRYA